MEKSPAWVIILMNCIKTTVAVIDLITLPFHLIYQRPWKKTSLSNQLLAERADENDPYSAYTSTDELTPSQIEFFKQAPTVIDLFEVSARKYTVLPCLGARTVYKEEEEKQSNGKIFTKLVLGDYEWITYNEVLETVQNFSLGLLNIGLKPGDRVVIFADTCPEWLMSALACFSNNISIVTLYSNLGDDGIIHGVLETSVSVILTSQDLLPKLQKIVNKTPNVKHIVYFEKIKRFSTDSKYFTDGIDYHSFGKLENIGKNSTEVFETARPTSDSIAIIMYTSGSTGMPKAVCLTHKNIINATISSLIYKMDQKDIYIAYLPLAHVLELQAECMVMCKGIRIGYSSTLTLTDMSSKIKKGCPGDITLLKPTFMATVPMILERIKKSIDEKISKSNPFLRAILNYAITYKSAYYELGFDTPFINRVICSRFRKLVGGNIRIMASGGAPLSSEIHSYVRSCFNVKLLIGYGLTETCSANTVMREFDRSSGYVGAILPGSFLKLVDWEEGNYKPTDKPFPRGEIIIGGKSITAGYYKNEELTKECFFEENDVKWFRTGDIGEIIPSGTLKIIDRKKDIVKLQTGEYISLVKIETIIKELSEVDNVCVIANSLHSYVTALMVPNQLSLNVLAEKYGKINGNHNIVSRDVLCKDKDIIKGFRNIITEHCKGRLLSKFETPEKIALCAEAWTPDTGVVTSTFKLKRKALEATFASEIKTML